MSSTGLRRWALPLLLAISAFGFAACGGGDDDDDNTTPGDEAASTGTSTESTETATSESSSQAANTPTGAAGSADLKPIDEAAVKAMEGLPLYPDLAEGTLLGKPDAKVTLTVWEDFQCPHCLNYTVQTETMIRKEYVETGKIQYRVMALPILGDESVRAAVAGFCAAEQDRFFELHKQLYLVQAQNGQLSGEKLNVGRFTDGELLKYAVDAGVDQGAYEACYGGQESIDAITSEIRAAQDAGFRGTPAFMLGETALSGQPGSLDGWRKLLDDAIAAAE